MRSGKNRPKHQACEAKYENAHTFKHTHKHNDWCSTKWSTYITNNTNFSHNKLIFCFSSLCTFGILGNRQKARNSGMGTQ